MGIYRYTSFVPMAKDPGSPQQFLLMGKRPRSALALGRQACKKVEWAVFKIKQTDPVKVLPPHPVMWSKPVWQASKVDRNVDSSQTLTLEDQASPTYPAVSRVQVE